MSWQQWSSGAQPSVPPVLNPTAPAVNSAPAVVPPGLQYTPDQWAQLQQQNWNQWAQWQQQYQQWHQQYGAEYQKSINALAQASQPPLTTLPNVAVPPPLPTETKPPLPTEDPPPSVPSYTTAPPQGYQTGVVPKNNERPQQVQRANPNWNQNYRYDDAKRHPPPNNKAAWPNQMPQAVVQPTVKPKENVEELSDAEKKFDKQFALWEAQFNNWKEKNVEHPDKEQYNEYEKRWESWRAQLLERREQMKRKRLGLTVDPPNRNRPGFNQNQAFNSPQPNFIQTPAKIPPAKGDAQLGASASSGALFNKPPPNLNDEPLNFKESKIFHSGPAEEAVEDFLKPNTGGGIPGLDLVKDEPKPQSASKRDADDVIFVDPDEKDRNGPDFDAISKGINSILGDQKLLNMLSLVSQTQTPKVSDNVVNTVSRIQDGNNHPSLREQSNQSYGEHSSHSEHFESGEFVNNFDDQTRSSFTTPYNEYESGGNFNRNQRPDQNQFPNRFGNFNKDNQFGAQQSDETRREFNQNRFGNDRFPPGQDRMGYNQDRFGPGQERFGQNRFGPNQERFEANQNRFPPHQDGFGPKQGRFGPNQDKFAPNQDRFGPNQNRFGPNQDRFGPNQDKFPQNQERFGLNKNRFPANRPDPGARFGPQDQLGPNQNRFGFNQDGLEPTENRFEPNQNRFEPNQNRFEPNQNRFEPNQNRFEPKQNRFEPNQDRFEPNPEQFEPNQERFGPNENMFSKRNDGFDRTNDQNFGGRKNYRKFGKFDQNEDYNNYDYDEVAARFQEEEPLQNELLDQSKANEPPLETLQKPLEIFQAAVVTDYDHKPPKQQVEAEVLIEPIHMYDYRHKPLSRIPLPQRPKWLLDTVKNIREFDPPVVRPYEPPGLRRYPPPPDVWRNEGYQPHRRNYDNRQQHDRRRPYARPFDDSKWMDRKRDYDERKLYQEIDLEEEKISDTEWPEDEPEEIKKPKIGYQKPDPKIKTTVLIEDLICPPGRYNRPPRIVIILRGPPGSGKTFLAKLIKDKEVENGGSTPRILSLDDYFMVEQEKEVTEEGKKVKIKEMVYEYEAEMEDSYRTSLIKSFKKTVTDGYFSFIIVDNVNDRVKYFGEMWSFAKQNGFQVFICQLDLDVQTCTKRNIHGRTEDDIEKCVAGWEATPSHHPNLDATSLLQSASIPEVEMEEVNSPESESSDVDGSEDQVARSKWDNFDCSVHNLAKLDGVNKPLRTSRTMEEYLQLDTEWTPIKPTRPGQKRVRWADLEEQKQQEKMRAIGFVVGHTNWDRMMDPSGGSSALTQTKYIERTGRYKVDQK